MYYNIYNNNNRVKCCCLHINHKRRKNEEMDEISTDNQKEISLPKYIHSETNLLVLPFFALTRKTLKNKLETEYRDIVKRGNQKRGILWNVSANPKYGYPGLFDRGVHKAIEQIISEILKEKGKVENPIYLGSLYGLCRIMGISEDAGVNYRMIKKALGRIRATTIRSVGTFYSKEGKRWVDDNFSLYDRIVFKGKELPNGEIADSNYLFLGSWYLQNLNSFYVKPIDYNYFKSLKNKIASRLYEILGVKFYGVRNKKQDFICYKYSTLCQLLPITRKKYISMAKQQLNPSNNELKDTGFISKYDWGENSRKDWLVYYWPGERAKKEMRRAKTRVVDPQTGEYLLGPEKGLEIFSREQNDLINNLVEINVSRITAEGLIIKYDQQLIKKWIEAISYSNAGDKAAYMVKAIRENWQFPEEYLREIKEEEQKEEREKTEVIKIKQQEEENKKRQEEIKKIEQMFNALNPLQQEEIKKETENRLPDFWKEKLNKVRVKGETSKLLEVVLEEKRREIIKEWIDSGRIKV